jgi:hypothetical protein
MIEHLHFQNYQKPADSLARPAYPLVLDPAYQRASVWTLEQRRNLIKSMLEGLPIGAVFLNHRDWETTIVVDGKQRIETISMFMDDAFAIPGAWFGFSNPSELRWSELAAAVQRVIRNTIISTYETTFPTEKQELDLYLRINYGGTPHPAQPGD